MFRNLIAIIVAIAIAIAGAIEPAYAYTNDSSGVSVSHHIHITQGDNSSVSLYQNQGEMHLSINQGNYGTVNLNHINNSADKYTTENSSESLIDNVVTGVVENAVTVIGGAMACYALDGIATAFFPPAAVLAPFCAAL
ncbi:hypothetical protein [Nostoc favosum]|uniref:Uncharacterized protein n=1 Tax=Nostoc favosum CHAB5714 TaxID=2780399 RepID=A0ABS8IJY3_9NOSO|nr:hypothetical protein [Nostoc favosum]MCC5603802.1 hypothetical protein [Nostoc favosum CHAB5714]